MINFKKLCFLWIIPILLTGCNIKKGHLSEKHSPHLFDLGPTESFSKIELRKEIADAQIVFIGEQNHYSNGVLKLNNEIIKYLIDSMQFEIIIEESCNLSLHFAIIDLLKETANVEEILAYHYEVFPSKVMRQRTELYNYLIPKIRNKSVSVHGMDISCLSVYNNAFLFEFPKYCMSLDSNKYRFLRYDKLFLDFLASGNWKRNNKFFSSEYQDFVKSIDINTIKCMKDSLLSFLCDYDSTAPHDLHAFWKWSLEDKVNSDYQNLFRNDTCYRFRDKTMAKNVSRIVNKYPKKKVIVRASNYHIADYDYFDFDYPCDSSRSMYSFFCEQNGTFKNLIRNIACVSLIDVKEDNSSCKCKGDRQEITISRSVEAGNVVLLKGGIYCLKPSFKSPYFLNWDSIYSSVYVVTEAGKYDWVHPELSAIQPYPINDDAPNILRSRTFDTAQIFGFDSLHRYLVRQATD